MQKNYHGISKKKVLTPKLPYLPFDVVDVSFYLLVFKVADHIFANTHSGQHYQARAHTHARTSSFIM